MKYKLFLTDYDGTLGHLEDIDPETVEAIKDYQARGGKFVICTGRSFYSILPILKKYNLTGDIIVFQGAEIVNIESGKVIYEGEVDKYAIIDIVERLEKAGFSIGVYLGDFVHYSTTNEEMKFYLSHVGIGATKEDSLVEALKKTDLKIRKIVALGSEELVNKYQKELSAYYEGRLIVNSSDRIILEAISPFNTKGEGVKRIANYYNIPLSEVITVGDSLNDMELVKGEWHGVAVGNAVDELKNVAKEVTVDFKDHPIKLLLEKYGK